MLASIVGALTVGVVIACVVVVGIGYLKLLGIVKIFSFKINKRNINYH